MGILDVTEDYVFTVGFVDKDSGEDPTFFTRLYRAFDWIPQGKQPSIVLALDPDFPDWTLAIWTPWLKFGDYGKDIVGMFNKENVHDETLFEGSFHRITINLPRERVLEILRESISGLKMWEGKIPILKKRLGEDYWGMKLRKDFESRKSDFVLI